MSTPNNNRVVILVNHLKSKGYRRGNESPDERRKRQARRVAEIYHDLIADGEEFIAVVGDFNDYPGSDPMKPLLAQTDLKDISEHPQFDDGGRPGTFGNCTQRQKIDYILLSPQVYARATSGGILRKGAWGGKNGDMWERYRTVRSPVEAASDHCAIWADLDV